MSFLYCLFLWLMVSRHRTIPSYSHPTIHTLPLHPPRRCRSSFKLAPPGLTDCPGTFWKMWKALCLEMHAAWACSASLLLLFAGGKKYSHEDTGEKLAGVVRVQVPLHKWNEAAAMEAAERVTDTIFICLFICQAGRESDIYFNRCTRKGSLVKCGVGRSET